VPKGFTAVEYTFISNDVGWALGSAPCSQPPCTSLLRTRDGGRTWVGVPAPRVELHYPCARPTCGSIPFAGHVIFADERNGWVYGSVLYVTHDGALHWHQVPPLQGIVGVLAGNGTVLVLHQFTRHEGQCVEPDCSIVASEADSGSDSFRQVPLPTFAYGNYGWPARHADKIWLLVGGSKNNTLFRSVDAGQHWSTLHVPCANSGAAQLDVTASGELWTVCPSESSTNDPPGYLLVSPDGGTTWNPPRPIPHGHDPQQGVLGIAVSADGHGYANVASDTLLVTNDDGQHWQRSLYIPKRYLESIGSQDATHAHALAGAPSTGMWRTTDGGAHWTLSAFRD
jgi:photosystem II stability/assembly factor-like uncharacterized protein